MKLFNKLIIVSIIFLTINCFAQDVPKTPAGNRVKEVVELLNGTSSYELGDYINNQYAAEFKDAFPVETHKGMIERTQTMFGKVSVTEITKSTQNEISIVLKSEMKDAWLNFTLQVEKDEPHRIVSMGFRPGSPPSDNAKNTDTPFSNLDELHQYLIERTKDNEFSGTVLIAKNGDPIF